MAKMKSTFLKMKSEVASFDATLSQGSLLPDDGRRENLGMKLLSLM